MFGAGPLLHPGPPAGKTFLWNPRFSPVWVHIWPQNSSQYSKKVLPRSRAGLQGEIDLAPQMKRLSIVSFPHELTSTSIGFRKYRESPLPRKLVLPAHQWWNQCCREQMKGQSWKSGAWQGTFWAQHRAATLIPPGVLGQSCTEGRKPFLFSEQNKNYNLKPDPTSAIYSVNSGFKGASRGVYDNTLQRHKWKLLKL